VLPGTAVSLGMGRMSTIGCRLESLLGPGGILVSINLLLLSLVMGCKFGDLIGMEKGGTKEMYVPKVMAGTKKQ